MLPKPALRAGAVLLAALAPHTLPAQITVDGSLGTDPYTFSFYQNVPTTFGDNSDADTLAANGSEQDGLHAAIVGSDLHLLLTGNLETNFNKLEIFIDSKPGGQNTLAGDNPDIDFNGLNAMAGLSFDECFGADYYLNVSGGGSPVEFFVNYAELRPGGTAIFLGQADTAGTAVDLLNDVRIGIDNSNTAGVSATAVNTPDAVTTGIELRIPLSLVGGLNEHLRITAFINSDNHSFVSNKSLPGSGSATNLGSVGSVDFASLAGDQFTTVHGQNEQFGLENFWTNTGAGDWTFGGNWSFGSPVASWDAFARIDNGGTAQVTSDIRASNPSCTVVLGSCPGDSGSLEIAAAGGLRVEDVIVSDGHLMVGDLGTGTLSVEGTLEVDSRLTLAGTTSSQISLSGTATVSASDVVLGRAR